MAKDISDCLDRAADIRAGEELDAAKLGVYLRRQFPTGAGGLQIEQFPRGHSNLTYLVRFGELELVLRRPPFGSKVKAAHDMAREYRVLSKLQSAYSCAPRTIAYCDDVSVIGAPFYLMERIRGVILRKDPPPGMEFSADIARQLSEAFIDNLARLHSLDYVAIGLGDLGRPEGYMPRQVYGWIDRYHKSQTHELPEVPAIAGWLKANLPVTSGAALIHNDYRYDNLILDANNITRIIGVLDWEMSTIGDPLADLGTALAYWVEANDSEQLHTIRWGPTHLPGSLTRAQLLERYARLTRRDISGIAFYLAFARFKAAVIAQQIFYRFQQGLTKDARFAAMLEKTRILMKAALEASDANSI